MKTHKLNAEPRTESGKNACNRLRSKGYIPGVMYSHGKAEAVQIPKHEFVKLFRGHISESVLIDLTIPGSKEAEQKVIVKDYQLDPVTDEVLHLDFYKVTTGEKIHTSVPIIVTGTSKGERLGGILEVVEREVEIESLPADLPEKIEIDVTNLDLGHSIHVKDLPVSGSVKFLGDIERVVVMVMTPKAAKEEEVAVEQPEAVEAEAEEPKDKKEE